MRGFASTATVDTPTKQTSPSRCSPLSLKRPLPDFSSPEPKSRASGYIAYVTPPSTPVFVPSPKLRLGAVPELSQSIESSASSAIDANLLIDRFRFKLEAKNPKTVILKDFKVSGSALSGVAIDALVNVNEYVIRIFAEGTDIVHSFADALGEELFGCAVRVTLEQLVTVNHQPSGITCVTSAKVFWYGSREELVVHGLGDDAESAIGASIKAVCCALSIAMVKKPRDLGQPRREQKNEPKAIHLNDKTVCVPKRPSRLSGLLRLFRCI